MRCHQIKKNVSVLSFFFALLIHRMIYGQGGIFLLKLIGSALILLACSGFVLSKEREFTEHKRQLEDFALLLSLLQNEMCRLRFPLPVVLEHCWIKMCDPYGKLCEQVQSNLIQQERGEASAIWSMQVEAARKQFLLDDAECQLLSEIGEVFRMDNVELKEELFEVYRKRLLKLTKDYETSLVSRRRLNRYGTVLAGVFVIILLL